MPKPGIAIPGIPVPARRFCAPHGFCISCEDFFTPVNKASPGGMEASRLADP
jgi:hypothetical protein